MTSKSKGPDMTPAMGNGASIRIITAERERWVSFLRPHLLLRALFQQRALIVEFTRREIAARYKGLRLGHLWAFLNPLLFLAIYTVVFGLILHVRWPESRSDSFMEFATTLFCGLIFFNVLNESAIRATSVLMENRNYVKRAVFPFEILPFCTVTTALFHGLVSLIALVAVHWAIGGGVHLSLLAAPLLLLPLAFLAAGMAWGLACLGVVIRDVQQAVAPLLMALFFLTPILYSPSMVPGPLWQFARLNPLAFLVDGMRRAVLWGLPLDTGALILCTLACAGVMILGYAAFMSARDNVVDAL